MSATIKKALTFTLIAFLVVTFSAVASAEKKQGSVWYNGTVTQSTWTEGKNKYIEIEVDGEQYIFLSGDRVKMTRQYKAANGQWNSENLSLDKVYKGTKVLMQVEGMCIHQLTVEEK